MATMLVVLILLLTGLAITASQANYPVSIFERGYYTPNLSYYYPSYKKHPDCAPPNTNWPLLISRPEEKGTYPVIMFHHGTFINASWYSHLLRHVTSHGYIIVAPQFDPLLVPILPSPQHEINSAAKIANWLKLRLNTCNVLPQHIKADLKELSLAGHSRGGYVAYAVALGLSKITLTIPIASIAAIPVAGSRLPFFNFDLPLEPKFITETPCSLNLPNNIPQAIIGSQLGDRGLIPCAPPKLSHEEFFNECQPPCGHFVVSGCGHMDILDDHTPSYGPASWVKCDGCGGNSCRNLMRKSVGGVMVAFFKGVVTGDYADYNSILRNPNPNFSTVKNKTCPTSTGNGHLIYSA